jgi:hypothetical protein
MRRLSNLTRAARREPRGGRASRRTSDLDTSVRPVYGPGRAPHDRTTRTTRAAEREPDARRRRRDRCEQRLRAPYRDAEVRENPPQDGAAGLMMLRGLVLLVERARSATALLPHQDQPPRTTSTSAHSESSSVGGVGCSWLLSVGSCREFVISRSPVRFLKKSGEDAKADLVVIQHVDRDLEA